MCYDLYRYSRLRDSEAIDNLYLAHARGGGIELINVVALRDLHGGLEKYIRVAPIESNHKEDMRLRSAQRTVCCV